MISVRPKRRLGTCVPAGGVSEARNSTPSGRAGVDIWLGLPPALARRRAPEQLLVRGRRQSGAVWLCCICPLRKGQCEVCRADHFFGLFLTS
jgi:hypothetical protein